MLTDLYKNILEQLQAWSGGRRGNFALLSLTDTEIKLAVLVTGQEQGIVRLATCAVPEKAADLASTVEELLQREVVESLQLPQYSLGVLVAGQWAYAERFLLPRLPHKELLQSVSWDVAQGVHFPAGSYDFDAIYLDKAAVGVAPAGNAEAENALEKEDGAWTQDAAGFAGADAFANVGRAAQTGFDAVSKVLPPTAVAKEEWQQPVLAAAVTKELLQGLQSVAEKLEINFWGVTVRPEQGKQVAFADTEAEVEAVDTGSTALDWREQEETLPLLGNFYNRKEEAELRTSYAELFWFAQALLERKSLLRMGGTGVGCSAFGTLPLEKLSKQAAAVVAAATLLFFVGSGIMRGVAEHRVAVAEAELSQGQLALWRNRSAESSERAGEVQRLKSGWDSIHRNQPQWGLRLNALGKSMPKNCWLVKLSEGMGDKVILEGRTLDMAALNSFMERLQKTGQWQSIQLAEYGEAVGNKAQQSGTIGFRIELKKGGATA